MRELVKVSPEQVLGILTYNFKELMRVMGIERPEINGAIALNVSAKASLRERDYGRALKCGTLAGRVLLAAEIDENAEKLDLARRLVNAEMGFASAAKAAEELETSDIHVNGYFSSVLILERFRQAQIRHLLRKTHSLSIPYEDIAREIVTRCNDLHHKNIYSATYAPSIKKLERVLGSAQLGLSQKQAEGFFRDPSIVLFQAYKDKRLS
jgi:hypothetical protein